MYHIPTVRPSWSVEVFFIQWSLVFCSMQIADVRACFFVVALDTTSLLPLLNSLTHLTYLTSTSPRICEILTCDGGLKRLVRLLRDFCLSPPPPESPALIFGLSPIGLPQPQLVPALSPKVFDRHTVYCFSHLSMCRQHWCQRLRAHSQPSSTGRDVGSGRLHPRNVVIV